MKIAYLILAHANPQHLDLLIKAISDTDSAIFIHIDKKSDMEIFSNIKGDNIHFIKKRVNVYWGEFSQVTAIINLIHAALFSSVIHQRLVLISGVDYPIKPKNYIKNLFEAHHDKEFINLIKMPSEKANKPISRLTAYRIIPSDSLFKKSDQ